MKLCGLDAYLFLRYLQVLLWKFGLITFPALPALLPVNVLEGRGHHEGVTGLDLLSSTNIDPSRTTTYWVHLVLALLVIMWTCRVIYPELDLFVKIRDCYVAGASSDTCGRTIFIANVPVELLDSAKLKELYDLCPGGFGMLQSTVPISLTTKTLRSPYAHQTEATTQSTAIPIHCIIRLLIYLHEQAYEQEGHLMQAVCADASYTLYSSSPSRLNHNDKNCAHT